MKEHFKQFGKEFKDAFIKTLANTVAGGLLVVLGFGLAQMQTSKRFLNRIVTSFEKITEGQNKLYEGLLQHLKQDHENDSLKSKNMEQIKNKNYGKEK